jgi:hypothetical protein
LQEQEHHQIGAQNAHVSLQILQQCLIRWYQPFSTLAYTRMMLVLYGDMVAADNTCKTCVGLLQA